MKETDHNQKAIEDEAIKEARVLHDVRTKNDKMTNPAYYEGAKEGFIAGRSKSISRERELEEALQLAYNWAEFTGVQSLDIFVKAKNILNKTK